jgi:hypothetical protein
MPGAEVAARPDVDAAGARMSFRQRSDSYCDGDDEQDRRENPKQD